MPLLLVAKTSAPAPTISDRISRLPAAAARFQRRQLPSRLFGPASQPVPPSLSFTSRNECRATDFVLVLECARAVLWLKSRQQVKQG